LIELHRLPRPEISACSIPDRKDEVRSFAAVQDFALAYDRFGSKAAVTAAQHWRPVYLSQQTLEVAGKVARVASL
jgi:hypothetical protein